MNLGKKKALAARTLKVGKDRIVFIEARLQEIKEAITKQDIRDLVKSGAIVIKNVKGRKTIVRRKSRSPGNVRRKRRSRKRDYIIMVRKLRGHVKGLEEQGKISRDETKNMRKKIRNKFFRSKAHLKEHIGGLK
ncbi:MAG: 50S ribosomal protein L19e [Nanoarchaeota archaeon]|nr:50S ribosomal protein L19e [Nanoarchaeota archaeon]